MAVPALSGLQNEERTPLFSIGLTTYNRRGGLKRALQHLLAQTFGDFEIIVGNDYTAEKLDAEALGICDPRVRFINHPVNLGEAGNLNALLAAAKGRYFAWQFDDDLTHPDFLRCVDEAFRERAGASCVFIRYQIIEKDELPSFPQVDGKLQWLSGRDFLRGFLGKRFKTLGCAVVYEREFLQQMGGMEKLCDSKIAFYGEYLLPVQCGLLDWVGYMDFPFLFYRVHPDSWSVVHGHPGTLAEAGLNLMARSVECLTKDPLASDFAFNFRSMTDLVCGGVTTGWHQESGRFPIGKLFRYLEALRERIQPLLEDKNYQTALRVLRSVKLEIIRVAVCSTVRSLLTRGRSKTAP